MTWYGKRLTAILLTGRSVGKRGTGDPEPGNQGSARCFHRRHQRTRSPDVLGDLRTSDRRGGTRRSPRLRIERANSPPTEISFGALPNVFPRHAGRLARHHSTGALFDFSGPCCLDFGGVLGVGVIQTCEEFSRHIRAFGDGQPQGLTKKFLRAGRHVAILDSAGQPNKRPHQTAACFRAGAGEPRSLGGMACPCINATGWTTAVL